jgi:hypothetical protein
VLNVLQANHAFEMFDALIIMKSTVRLCMKAGIVNGSRGMRCT